jgi:hypothetical protein
MAKGIQSIGGTEPDMPPAENNLEHPSFTIEFLEHLSPTAWQHWLDQITVAVFAGPAKSHFVNNLSTSRIAA